MVENYMIDDFSLSAEEMMQITALDTEHSVILDLHAPAEVERLYQIKPLD